MMHRSPAVLELTVLGPPAATWAGAALPIPRRQTRALLYRLATSLTPVPRSQICFLFWPDLPDAAARRNLTHLLTHLRQALPEPQLVEADSDRIALSPASVRSDTATLARIVVSARPPIDTLRQAAALVRGPFLSGFSLPDCPEFETWADAERARWERITRELLATLAERAAAEERYDDAIWAAQRGLALDDLDEMLHRQLITLYGTMGDRAAVEHQYARCVTILDRELGVPPLPETRDAYLAARAGPPLLLNRPHRPRSQARTAPDILVGRDQDLAIVVAQLHRSTIRLLTLTGAGGVGKTRLARAVAAHLAPSYADGTVFVPLAPVQAPGLVATAIAAACGLRDTSDRDALAHLLDVLRERQVLLVLDNLEHLLAVPRLAPGADALSVISAILAVAPGVRVLATSRALLRLADEHVYIVPPLPVADDPAGALAPAVELFLTRAQATAPDFQLGPRTRADVAALCARLDGLPLAIELAAARMRLLTPRALLARLSRRFEVLVGGPRDHPERQQTLRATIDWSYALLEPTEQRLLRRLAVFAGGFSLELAEQTTAEPDGLSRLERLGDHSLLQRAADVAGEPRFMLLETIHAYALERLMEHGEEPAVRHAHARCLLAFAERAAPELLGADQSIWLDRLELEQDNLRSALAWTRTHDVPTALRLVAALGAFWIARGSLSEGRTWLEDVLTAAGWRGATQPLPVATVELTGAVASFGQVLFHQGAFAAAMPLLTVAVDQFDQLGLSRAAVWSRHLLIPTLAIQGDHAGAADHLLRLTALDDPTARALIARSSGMAALHRGDNTRALRYLEHACAAFRDAASLRELAVDLLHLGTICVRLDQQRAAACFAEANELALALKDRSLEGMTRNNLGELARVRGEYATAAAHYTASLRLLHDTDRRNAIPRLLHNLGYVALRSGDTAGAHAHFHRSLALFSPHDPRGVMEALDGLAAVATVRGLPLLAARLWGATAAERGRTQNAAWLPDQIEAAHYGALARSACAPATFAAAWTAGQARTLEQAVADAGALDPL